jgi:hypothetical protein
MIFHFHNHVGKFFLYRFCVFFKYRQIVTASQPASQKKTPEPTTTRLALLCTHSNFFPKKKMEKRQGESKLMQELLYTNS